MLNTVENDSRVLKTAQAAMNAGYEASVIGASKANTIEDKLIEGIKVRLIPNYVSELRKYRLWSSNPQKRDIGLLVGGYANALLPQIAELCPDIVHSHDMNCLKLGALSRTLLNASGRDARWVHDLHEFVPGLRGEIAEAYKPTCLEWERAYLHTADHLITVSEPLAERVAARYVLPAAPTVVHNTPYRSSFGDRGPDVRTAIGLSPEVPLVVFVGGANALRGCETITRAISRLPDVHVVFVSEGPYVQSLRDLAASLGISDRFHTHDYVKSEGVTSFIRTGDVGVHGLVRYPNGEVALPNKLFEYLHAGLPVVTSDVEAMSQFVQRHVVGEVFIAEDDVSCAAALKRALDKRAALQAHITDALVKSFSWETQEQKLQAIYAELLQRRGAIDLAARNAANGVLAAERAAFEQRLSVALLSNAVEDLARQSKVLASLAKGRDGQAQEVHGTPVKGRRRLQARFAALLRRVKWDGTIKTMKHT